MARSIADSTGCRYAEESDAATRTAAYNVRHASNVLPAPIGLRVTAICVKCMTMTTVDASVFELAVVALCPACTRSAGRRLAGL